MTKDKFTKLVCEYENTLYTVAISMMKNEHDCEDAIQTAILKAFEKLSTLKHEEYFKTWLVRILINVCKKNLKKQNNVSVVQEDISSNDNDSIEVRLALENLPDKIRQVVVLHYIESFTTKEVADILSIPKGTVLSRLAKGRELLKLELE